MKRVIIMKGFCDLIYDISNNSLPFVEQQRIYLENFQRMMHQFWSITSKDDEESLGQSTSSPITEGD